VGLSAGNLEGVACALRRGIQRNQGCNSGSIHAVNVCKVQQHAILPHHGREPLHKSLFLPSDQFIQVVWGNAQGGGGVGCVGVHHKFLPWEWVLPGDLIEVHPARQTLKERIRLNPEGIAADCSEGLALPGVRFREPRSISNTFNIGTHLGDGEVPQNWVLMEDRKQSAALSAETARAVALHAGFAAAGLAPLPHANTDRDASRFKDWIEAGRAGTMGYLERRTDDGELVRARAETPFPWARSAVVCFALYHSDQPLSTDPAPAGAGWIARYAWSSRRDASGTQRPSDYHKVLLKRIRAVEAALQADFGKFESRAYVDTGPLVERSLAVAAGLGWVGKNTCLIHPKLGSFGFLAVLLTSLPVAEGAASFAPHVDRCGSCRRCIDACPTGALVAPYQMDARRCISYLTIEHKGPIAPELMETSGRQVFGCDICQDVCPWNRKAPGVPDAEMSPRQELVNPLLDWLAEMDQAEWEQQFNGSPVRRTGFHGMQRNVAVAIGNSGQRRFVPRLRAWASAADAGLRAAAQWAIRKLEG
jgi:epoxyqueuosine reductase